ncbi:hypothetical protein [Rahnella contaminans]|uniref:hypothetical protein n=1 Tax=Rahnella contaminans TaxID=2703882 RepID=UPI003C2B6042
MYYVDNSSGVETMPDIKPVYSTDPTWFTEGGGSKSPTYPGPDWFNMVNLEMVNILAAASMEPNKGDCTQLAQAIKALIISSAPVYVPDIHEIKIYDSLDINPNEKWPGTTWVQLPDYVSLRTGKADGSDVLTTVGADSVTLTADNAAPHAHTIGGSTGNSDVVGFTTDDYDFGPVTTSDQPAHQHNSGVAGGNPRYGSTAVASDYGMKGSDNANQTVMALTDPQDEHTHTVDMPPHSHTGAVPAHSHPLPAETGSVGSALPISVVPNSILLIAWRRTA